MMLLRGRMARHWMAIMNLPMYGHVWPYGKDLEPMHGHEHAEDPEGEPTGEEEEGDEDGEEAHHRGSVLEAAGHEDLVFQDALGGPDAHGGGAAVGTRARPVGEPGSEGVESCGMGALAAAGTIELKVGGGEAPPRGAGGGWGTCLHCFQSAFSLTSRG
jgi:hypothetical protein